MGYEHTVYKLTSALQHTDIRDLEEKITSERQERLSLSDRLAAAQKVREDSRPHQ